MPGTSHAVRLQANPVNATPRVAPCLFVIRLMIFAIVPIVPGSRANRKLTGEKPTSRKRQTSMVTAATGVSGLSGATNPIGFREQPSIWLMAGRPAVIADHEARDVHRLEVR